MRPEASVPSQEDQDWRRAVDDVIAAQLAARVEIERMAGPVFGWTGFSLPMPIVRDFVTLETELAAEGARGLPYDESVTIILYAVAAKRCMQTGADLEAVHARMTEHWERYVKGKN